MDKEHQWHDWSKQDRARLRDIALRLYAYIGALCLLFLFALAATWPTKAHGTDIPVHVLDKDGIEIRLMNTPCVDPKSIAQISPAFLERFKAIFSVWPERDGTRKVYRGCWAELKAGEYGAMEDTFILVFEDNTNGTVPKSEFKKTKGTRGA